MEMYKYRKFYEFVCDLTGIICKNRHFCKIYKLQNKDNWIKLFQHFSFSKFAKLSKIHLKFHKFYKFFFATPIILKSNFILTAKLVNKTKILVWSILLQKNYLRCIKVKMTYSVKYEACTMCYGKKVCRNWYFP